VDTIAEDGAPWIGGVFSAERADLGAEGAVVFDGGGVGEGGGGGCVGVDADGEEGVAEGFDAALAAGAGAGGGEDVVGGFRFAIAVDVPWEDGDGFEVIDFEGAGLGGAEGWCGQGGWEAGEIEEPESGEFVIGDDEP
jgi:hypothetical protein